MQLIKMFCSWRFSINSWLWKLKMAAKPKTQPKWVFALPNLQIPTTFQKLFCSLFVYGIWMDCLYNVLWKNFIFGNSIWRHKLKKYSFFEKNLIFSGPKILALTQNLEKLSTQKQCTDIKDRYQKFLFFEIFRKRREIQDGVFWKKSSNFL
jgi:hypothetical protein